MSRPLPPHRAPPVEDRASVLKRAHSRSHVALLIVGLSYGILAGRATQLMVVPDGRLGARAATQFQTPVVDEAPRGEIHAGDGTLLAATVDMPVLRAAPSKLAPDQVEPLSRYLSDELDIDRGYLIKQLSRHHRQDVKLAQDVNPEQIDALLGAAPEGALFVRTESTRYYPGRELAAQVLGVVSRSTGVGQEGVERQLNSDLRGSTYRTLVRRDRRGRDISSEIAKRRAGKGDVVTLTLDATIQRAAEDALDEVVAVSAPLSATAVVLDVQTGAILAMASRPTANPNDRGKREGATLRNRAVADQHEPGSVLKPFVMALALDDEQLTPSTRIDCEGGIYRIGGTPIRDDHRYNVISASEIIKYSSNIGMAKIADKMGAERLMDGLMDFGFGEPTGVRLPAEAAGQLRSPNKIHPVELATTAFGQGMSATALQVASALQTLGNGGVRMKPLIVQKIEDRHGQTEFVGAPVRLRRVVSEQTATEVLAMMKTVMEEGGTGLRAVVPGYSTAGKTGTAQKVVDGTYSATARVSSFMGLAPADKPRIAVVVLVDTPTQGSRYGGTVAGPAYKTITLRALRYLHVPEDMPRGDADREELPHAPLIPLTGPVVVQLDDGRVKVPDFAGQSLRDVLASIQGSGLELAMSGSGHAVRQSPSAGRTLSPGERLEVHFD